MEKLKAREEERGKLEKREGESSKRRRGGMETSQTRLSDTAHQSSIRPADRYFQHEMTHQLYRGGVGERHRDKRKCVERERGLKGFIYSVELN